MMTEDAWLLRRAREKKSADAARKNGAPRGIPPVPSVDHLWSSLQAETRRQAAVYTEALDDPGALVVTTDADSIEAKALDGRRVTIRLNREQRSLRETYRDRAGAVRMGTPRIRFTVAQAGSVGFNCGAVGIAAGSILRRVLA